MSDKLAYYRVLYDYKHLSESNDNYLNIRAGDVIEVDLVVNEKLSKKEMMAGRLQGTNEIGFFPSNCVERQYSMSRRSTEEHPQDINHVNVTDNSIKSAPWYWADISKEEANEIMFNTLDGTFLVRDSTDKEESEPYTLTLRRNYKNLLIRISHSNGKYGLIKTLLFNSVEDLVDHYSRNSLVSFNSQLNLKLKFPMLKSVDRISGSCDIVELRNDFKILCTKHRELTDKFSFLQVKEKDIIEENKQMTLAIKVCKEIILMYREQTTVLSKSKFFGDVSKFSKENSRIIKNKIIAFEKTVTENELELSNLERDLEEVRTRLDKNECGINECSKEKDHKERLLINCGETQENIDLIKERREVITIETFPHLKESLWLLMDCDRKQADILLRDKRYGTFLIRQKESGPYALSIVSCNVRTTKDEEKELFKSVYHCLIERRKSGFGFGEPFYIFKNLIDLVLYHKDVSLCQYNDDHDVTLAYPVFWEGKI